ncbi:MAG: LytR/AlgR family response regulator transcription factor [Saprospiraceae bacterium]
MKNIKAIIIDDERSAIETLRGMLGAFCPQVDIEAEATSVEAGLLAIRQYPPDLIFLDIELPPLGQGFDLLKMTPNRSFGVIFTTAYPEFAIKSINDAQPWGYLLKPYRVSDLVKTILIASEKIRIESQEKQKDVNIRGIIIPDSRKGNMVIYTKDILLCKADKGGTDIFVLSSDKVEKFSASYSLKDLEAQLPSNFFCRTHHSYIVNLRHIIRYQRNGRNGLIFFPHNIQAEISVGKMELFEAHFKQILKGGD